MHCDFVLVKSVWGENTERVLKSLQVSLEAAVVNVWSSHRLKFVFEVVTNAFSMFCESKGSLK